MGSRELVAQTVLCSSRRSNRLPLQPFSLDQVEAILQQPDLAKAEGLRDRVIMETLYAAALRRLELLRLRVQDLDFTRGLLLVREGKGRKDRVAPIGERAIHWLERYLDSGRPLLARPDSDHTLFLNRRGRPLGLGYLTGKVSAYVKAAGVQTGGSCHRFRHTVATLMLENGADIRHIQEMLGHASLRSTQIYTRVSVKQLKDVYHKTHPGADLRGRRRDQT